MKPAGLIAVVILCLSAVAAESTSENEIKDLIRRYDAAWLHKDVERVEQVLAPEYLYFTSDGRITDRNGTLDFLKKPSYKLDRSERSEIEIRRTGSTAIVSSRWVGTGNYDGKPINDDQRCGIVLSRIKGRWQILSEHCVQIVK